MRTNSIEFLITKGLGYCCEYLFFKYHKNTDLIAARLGVTTRAVRLHKAKLAEGTLTCKHCPDCLAERFSINRDVVRPVAAVVSKRDA